MVSSSTTSQNCCCSQTEGETVNDLLLNLKTLDFLFLFRNIHYIDFTGQEHYYTLTPKSYPQELEKKVKLLNYFRNYMREHLLKAGADMQMREGDELSRIPALRTWFRTSRAVVMHLSNGTLQVSV